MLCGCLKIGKYPWCLDVFPISQADTELKTTRECLAERTVSSRVNQPTDGLSSRSVGFHCFARRRRREIRLANCDERMCNPMSTASHNHDQQQNDWSDGIDAGDGES